MDAKYIEDNLLFMCEVGSTAYGTNIEGSDIDLGGVCLPSKKVVLGFDTFEQKDKWGNDANGEKIDKVIYSLPKAVRLILENNPNMLDYLWIPERCIKHITPEWEQLMSHRESLLSKSSYFRFQGYAVSQIERVKTHKRYIEYGANGPGKPNRSDYGLPETSLFPQSVYDNALYLGSEYVAEEDQNQFYLDTSDIVQSQAALVFRKYVEPKQYAEAMKYFKDTTMTFIRRISTMKGDFLKDEYQEMAVKEIAYNNDLNDYRRYAKWNKGRNPKRKLLEAKCGYDAKHIQHACRLTAMSNEILSGKGVLVDRTNIDAPYLKDIRQGNVAYEEVCTYIDGLVKEGDELFKTTTIQKKADRELAENLTMDILEKHIRNE
jgi:hypothetical protein